MIALSKIRIDGGTQARVELNQETVAEYAEAYRSCAAMPPVVLFYDGTTYWLADGFHRYFGAKQAGLEEIWEEITPGTQRDAVLFSLAANARHGLRRSNADKRKAVSVLLNDPEWSAWSSNEIAKRCGVGDHLVADVRKSLTSFSRSEEPASLRENLSEKQAERTYTTKHGTPATMNTANIGKKPAAPIQEEPEFNPDDYALAEAQERAKYQGAHDGSFASCRRCRASCRFISAFCCWNPSRLALTALNSASRFATFLRSASMMPSASAFSASVPGIAATASRSFRASFSAARVQTVCRNPPSRRCGNPSVPGIVR